jgi:hypothetical protein
MYGRHVTAEASLMLGNLLCDLFWTKQLWDSFTFWYLGFPMPVIKLPMFHIRIYVASE